MNYEHIKAEDFKWEKSELGVMTARFSDFGVIMSIVKGEKGSKTESHSHSEGSFVFIVKGKLKINEFTLTPGTAGKCRPGPGHYHVEFIEDSEYIVCRSQNDKILK
jgi:quercetin dioxygenase-like cupin family protein